MGEIYDQFELELANLGRKYARQPRRQMLRLFLLALEREAFLRLCGEQKTLARVQHTLKTGKPLRN